MPVKRKQNNMALGKYDKLKEKIGMQLPVKGGVMPEGLPPMPIQAQAPVEPQMSGEEMKKDLMNKFSGVEERKGTLDRTKEIMGSELQATKMNVIKSLFEYMKSVGVDPSDVDSVNKFLVELEKSDPDLYELFTVTFNNLLDMVEGNQSQPMEGVMGKYNNLAEGVLRGGEGQPQPQMPAPQMPAPQMPAPQMPAPQMPEPQLPQPMPEPIK